MMLSPAVLFFIYHVLVYLCTYDYFSVLHTRTRYVRVDSFLPYQTYCTYSGDIILSCFAFSVN